MKQLSEKYQKIWDEIRDNLCDNDKQLQSLNPFTEDYMVRKIAVYDMAWLEFLEPIITDTFVAGMRWHKEAGSGNAHKGVDRADFLKTVIEDKPLNLVKSAKNIIGMALILKGGVIDSYNKNLQPSRYYDIECFDNGKTIILPIIEEKL